MAHPWTAFAALPALLCGGLRAQERKEPVVHELRSKRQAGLTRVRVVLPDQLKKGRRYPTLYVLPVEAGEERRFGDGLSTLVAADLHNKHGLICVFPTFSRLPWYVDHPADSRSHQESYLLKDVVPLVDRTYPTRAGATGRFLVGFSKSGWGAYSLLLRNPEVFAVAGAWDAPLAKERPDQFGMRGPFGTQENFDGYEITALLRDRAELLRARRRLVLTGYFGFREHHQSVHTLMRKLKVRHVYRDGPKRKHVWGSGWLPELVGLVVKPAPTIAGVEVPEVLRQLGCRGVVGEGPRLFKELDADQDGVLTQAELRASGRLAGEDLVAAVYQRLDPDRDAEVRAAKFLSELAKWIAVE